MPRKAGSKKTDQHTLDLFEGAAIPAPELREGALPDADRFPLNGGGRKVRDVVQADIASGSEALIVAGYASISEIISLVASLPDDHRLRIVIGHEPFLSDSEPVRSWSDELTDEMKEYWLQQGLSISQSPDLVRCVDRVSAGYVTARRPPRNGRRLHAKIYVGRDGATLGSSNFTQSGLGTQTEANARFSAITEPKRFREAEAIAEAIWEQGGDFTDELLDLLRNLLKQVSWQEALARAIGELLEGNWLEGLAKRHRLSDDVTLWPSQRQGIAQALYVLMRHGSVLVADATGAGKTRMGAHLIGALRTELTRTSRFQAGRAALVAPPTVSDSWESEAVLAEVPLDVYSHGTLSHPRSRKHETTLRALRRAQILCVDEGHNFLSAKSARTQNLLRNMADHVILFTATPINKSAADLLRIADALGADNLADETIEAFQKLLGRKALNRFLSEAELDQLRKEIQRFTVRRTKRELNALVDLEPEAYRNDAGKKIRYPTHEPRIYDLEETEEDRRIAAEIRALAGELKAVAYFERTVRTPDFMKKSQGLSDTDYLARRLISAKKIYQYLLSALLRSSRAALYEHLAGTQAAVEQFELGRSPKAIDTGNMLQKLETIAGKPPRLELDAQALASAPDWLRDSNAHRLACAEDADILSRIAKLTVEMSDARERTKAKRLLSLNQQHSLVLAFDRSPTTLAYINRLIEEEFPEAQVLIATGDPGSDRAKITKVFAWNSEARGVIGLCSDSLSEGVNLQKASCIVHLDLPTVVRIAEQRAGRVDRMNSPHEAIEAWWPRDAAEFALTSDERFMERWETVENLLGSNMPLPSEMQANKPEPVDVNELIRAVEERTAQEEWDGIQDAFAPVRGLMEGESGLIGREIYRAYSKVASRVVSRVSLVRSDTPWSFFCLAGAGRRTPQWLFMDGSTGHVETDLAAVCSALREKLAHDPASTGLDARAAEAIRTAVARLPSVERNLLPRRKVRALEEMEAVLSEYCDQYSRARAQEPLRRCNRLLRVVRNQDLSIHPDWDEIASRWLEIIRPIWYQQLTAKRTRPLLLRDIRAKAIAARERLEPEIFQAFERIPTMPDPDRRISACILGVS